MMLDTAPETLPVSIQLVGIDRVRRGALLALIHIEVEISGVVLPISGIQILKAAGKAMTLRCPQYRCGDGTWKPSVTLPDEILLTVIQLLEAEGNARGLDAISK